MNLWGATELPAGLEELLQPGGNQDSIGGNGRLDSSAPKSDPTETLEARQNDLPRAESPRFADGNRTRVAGNARSWWRNSGKLIQIALPNRLFDQLGVPRLAG
jgi:hypothetical protein